MRPRPHQSVYKYKSLAELGNRDLACIVADQFFAPTVDQLNDPGEALLGRDQAVELLVAAHHGLASAVKEYEALRFANGVYSLSRTVTDEVMWAHYCESHHGYCVEYDLPRLLLEGRAYWNTLDVKYVDAPPRIGLDDFSRAESQESAALKPLGHKSLRWRYEEELRIVVPRAGLNSYARAAVTGIYFGLRFPDEKVGPVRQTLAGRNIRYYRMRQRPHSYEILPEELARIALDGTCVTHVAPLESEGVLHRDIFSGSDEQYTKWLRAVELVRRDPSCARIVGGDVSTNESTKGWVCVQFVSAVPMDLDPTVNWYFDPDRL
jgi:Protein of unknown function (DUF2971)